MGDGRQVVRNRILQEENARRDIEPPSVNGNAGDEVDETETWTLDWRYDS